MEVSYWIRVRWLGIQGLQVRPCDLIIFLQNLLPGGTLNLIDYLNWKDLSDFEFTRNCMFDLSTFH